MRTFGQKVAPIRLDELEMKTGNVFRPHVDRRERRGEYALRLELDFREFDGTAQLVARIPLRRLGPPESPLAGEPERGERLSAIPQRHGPAENRGRGDWRLVEPFVGETVVGGRDATRPFVVGDARIGELVVDATQYGIGEQVHVALHAMELEFDPPTSAAVKEALKAEIDEAEWRLCNR